MNFTADELIIWSAGFVIGRLHNARLLENAGLRLRGDQQAAGLSCFAANLCESIEVTELGPHGDIWPPNRGSTALVFRFGDLDVRFPAWPTPWPGPSHPSHQATLVS
jgi:hypothetical protein